MTDIPGQRIIPECNYRVWFYKGNGPGTPINIKGSDYPNELILTVLKQIAAELHLTADHANIVSTYHPEPDVVVIGMFDLTKDLTDAGTIFVDPNKKKKK